MRIPDHRKDVAKMLVAGHTSEEIANKWGLGVKSMRFILRRGGGNRKIISESLGPAAAIAYSGVRDEEISNARAAGGRASHEESLVTDVATDPSVTPRDRRGEFYGGQKPWEIREKELSVPKHHKPSSQIFEKYKNQVLRIIIRAAESAKNKAGVERMIKSLIRTLKDDAPTESDVPVVASSYISRAGNESDPQEKVLVLRVKRLTAVEAGEAGERGKLIDEFIGTLYIEVDRAQEPDSALGNALRAREFKRVELQTRYGFQPIELTTKQL